MTTTIRDGYDPEPDYTGITADGTKVRMHVRYKKVASIAAVGVLPRDEFLRAVETELNVKIIDRADLPDVETGANDFIRASTGPGFVSTHATHDTPDTLRRVALGWLAIAEHLEAHPPLDEEAVDMLATLIDGHDEPSGLNTDQIFRVARRLVQAGVRPPKDA